jgi:transcription-repair coupling factor (superfamily II helicase)
VQAFAYLFVPEESRLGRDAQKRLKVLMEHSDLGSGFQIALSDLKIRGGGTILGSSQSGHVAAVGYDMFFQLMENAMAELKGEPVTEPLEPEINVSMSAYIPESYIPDIDQRMSVYRRLSRTSELRDISDIKSELTDRFGPLPGETGNLLLKIMLKVMAQKAGVRRLNLNGQKVYLDMSEAHMKNPYGIVDLIDSDPGRYRLSPNRTLTAGLTGKTIHARLSEAKNLLNKISVHVN